jgi:hypothetical protein
MKSIRNVLFGTLVAGGALLATVGGLSIASAQEATTAATTNTGHPAGISIITTARGACTASWD